MMSMTCPCDIIKMRKILCFLLILESGFFVTLHQQYYNNVRAHECDSIHTTNLLSVHL